MVFLLTSQLRPLSYRLLPCTSSSTLWRGRLAYRCQADIYSCRGYLAAYVVQRRRNTEMLDWQSRAYYSHLPKEKRAQAFSVPKEGQRAWMGTPKLSQMTIFTIITNVMRRPLVARGVGDLGLRKLNRQPYFVSLNLFSYFLNYYVTY